jgi:hypothetical protein
MTICIKEDYIKYRIHRSECISKLWHDPPLPIDFLIVYQPLK